MIQILLLRPDKNGKLYHTHPIGFPTGLCVPNIDSLLTHSALINEKLLAAHPDNLKNVFYTVAHHDGVGADKPVRSEPSYGYQSVLPFDLDHTDQSRHWDYVPLVAQVLGVSAQSLIVIATGNGLHIIPHLKTPIRSAKYLKETKPNYNELVYKINRALKLAGLPGAADPSVYDLARILRLPNSFNVKMDKSSGLWITKECKLLQNPGLTPLDLDVVKLSGLDKISAENISPQNLKKNYPRPDFAEVMNQCEFMKWLVEHPEAVHEPQYQSALGLFGAMAPGDHATHDGKEYTAKEIAQWIFAKASSSKSLAGLNFEDKWEHGTRYGAPKCGTISSNWIGGCEKCPHFGKINTPLALKSDSHISSEVNHYWVIGKNGPMHPHYSDIAKIYARDHSYVTCEPDRILTFEQTHYKNTGQLTVKAWLEKTVGYEEHLREMHCVEFVKKVLRSNALTEAAEKDLFEQTILGKLNCKNGVVDVVRGEIIPHASTLGFKYVLPYDYEPDQTSEVFMEWLGVVMQNRTELIDATLDMMAYCLWPNYDDHVFAYLVGEGRNGKSTLLHVIQELLGKTNYSAVSMSQLGYNRFAPASLEGKLANVSEESSGTDLGFEALNVIKDLSAGGEIMAERKGQSHFMLKNTAKLIFSANKTPRFHESGKAIRSRLLVIPFDHTIENPDSSVENRLIAEVPKICSMLVKRIQDNLKVNGGRFKVSRGGEAAISAQEKVLLAGNSVVEFGKENIESGLEVPEGKYIGAREAYDRYKNWCEDSNYKALNVNQFGQIFARHVIGAAMDGSKVIRVSGKNVRVYPRTQWKEALV